MCTMCSYAHVMTVVRYLEHAQHPRSAEAANDIFIVLESFDKEEEPEEG